MTIHCDECDTDDGHEVWCALSQEPAFVYPAAIPHVIVINGVIALTDPIAFLGDVSEQTKRASVERMINHSFARGERGSGWSKLGGCDWTIRAMA